MVVFDNCLRWILFNKKFIRFLFNNFMYNKNTDRDLIGAGLTAALGAGVVTSFAVSQGQHPLIALGITAMAALFAVICRWQDLI